MNQKKEKQGPRVAIKTRAAGRAAPPGFSRLGRPGEETSVDTVADILRMPGSAAAESQAPSQPPAEAPPPSSADSTPVITPVVTPADTRVTTPADIPVTDEPERDGRAEDAPTPRPAQPQSLDATHSLSQQQVYSIMYRETISRGIREAHFRPKELMERTGIRSDRTIRTALDGLIEKLSIEITWERNGYPLGPRYRVFEPKEIMRRRRAAGLVIDPQTKKIVAPAETPVVTPVTTPASGPVATGGKNYPGSPAETTGVTGVDFAGDTSSSNKLNTIGDRDLSTTSSSSESRARADEEDDAAALSVREIFERLTGNTWATADELTLAEGKGVSAESWGLAICQCVDRAPGHTFARLAYVAAEARQCAEALRFIPAPDVRSMLRRSVERLARARESGAWSAG